MIVEHTMWAHPGERYAPHAFDKAIGRRIPFPSVFHAEHRMALVLGAEVDQAGRSCSLRLDLDPPEVNDARTQMGNTHPPTSRAAAARALPRSGSDRRRVYDLIAARGAEGATDDEIEVALGLPHQTASARRNGLRDDGWVADSGRRRPTRTGAEATVWVTCR